MGKILSSGRFRPVLALILATSLLGPASAAPKASEASMEEPNIYFGCLTPKQFYWTSAGTFAVAVVFDKAIRDDIFYYRNSDPSVEMRRLGDWGEKSGLVLGVVFGAQGLAFKNSKSKQTSVLLLESFVISGLAASGIKYVVGRERPNGSNYPGELGRHQLDSSFPSGHTTVAFSAATVIAEQYPKWYVAVPSYSAATYVGLSRMYANKHWASDVVAGAFLGTFISHTLRRHVLRKKKQATSWEIEPTFEGVRLVKKF